jgi:D-sedoheptulose 7-phosphate isomerase
MAHLPEVETDSFKEIALRSVNEVQNAAKTLLSDEALEFLLRVSALIADAFKEGKKVLIAGNGGSLCDAMHFAEELSGQFRKPRDALPALSLSDPAHMSCVANDFGFDKIFDRGVQAFGNEGDVLVVLTTSGNSPNIENALKTAIAKKLKTVAFLGKTGGKCRGMADLEWIVTGFAYSDRIQEAHMAALHIIVELIEAQMFGSDQAF